MGGQVSQSSFEDRHSHPSHRSSPFTDKKGCIFGVVAAPPKCDDWKDVNTKGSKLLEKTRTQCDFISKDKTHRRGVYPAMGYGISLGNGQKKPKRLSLRTENNCRIFHKLFSSDEFMRIAGAQSGRCCIKYALTQLSPIRCFRYMGS